MRPKLYGKQDMTDDIEKQARDRGALVARRLMRYTVDDTNNDPITLNKLDARAFMYIVQQSGQMAHAVIAANKLLLEFVEVVVSDKFNRDELLVLADTVFENAKMFADTIGETRVEID